MDDYPAEREKIYTFLQSKELRTWSSHRRYFTVHGRKSDIQSIRLSKYSPPHGRRFAHVEFVTPSISSANIDELLKVKGRLHFIQQTEGLVKQLNPHLSDVEQQATDIACSMYSFKTQAGYFFSDSITVPVKTENLLEKDSLRQ